MNKLFYLFLILLLIPITHAHLAAGEDKNINNYIIDFGYDPVNPKVNDQITLGFNLIDKTTNKVINPDNILVRISSSKEIVFAGTFHPLSENVLFTYKFPYLDNYEIYVQFNDKDKELVNTKFNLKIEDSSNNRVYYIIGIIVLIILIILIKVKKKN